MKNNRRKHVHHRLKRLVVNLSKRNVRLRRELREAVEVLEIRDAIIKRQREEIWRLGGMA